MHVSTLLNVRHTSKHRHTHKHTQAQMYTYRDTHTDSLSLSFFCCWMNYIICMWWTGRKGCVSCTEPWGWQRKKSEMKMGMWLMWTTPMNSPRTTWKRSLPSTCASGDWCNCRSYFHTNSPKFRSVHILQFLRLLWHHWRNCNLFPPSLLAPRCAQAVVEWEACLPSSSSSAIDSGADQIFSPVDATNPAIG